MDDNRNAGRVGGQQGILFGEIGEESSSFNAEKEAEALRPIFQPLLGKSWFDALKYEFLKEYMVALGESLRKKRGITVVYPEAKDVFRAFKETPLEEVKIFISGQDPYHDGSCTGIAFGNQTGDIKLISPSLGKIFERLEFAYDLGYLHFPSMNDYTLERWADQGVLLLNRVLTVSKGRAGSHRNMGWEFFTDRVVKVLNNTRINIIFMLWGADARELMPLINTKKHTILTTEHPAAACYRDRMWDCKNCFGKANEILLSLGKERILW